jgi:hypothetical protein
MVGRTNALSGERNRRLPGRVATSAPNTGRNLNYCLPRVRAHTPNTPAHSTFAAEYVAAFLIQSSNGPVLCRVGRRLARLVPLAVLSRCLPPVEQNFCLAPRYQPASDPLRQGTDLNEVGRRPLVHEWDHGGVNVTNPGKLFTFEGKEDGHRC